MRNARPRADVAFVCLAGSVSWGNSFLLSAPRVTSSSLGRPSSWHRLPAGLDDGTSSPSTCCRLSSVRMTATDASTHQQQPQQQQQRSRSLPVVGVVGPGEEEGEETTAAQVAIVQAAPSATLALRSGLASDGAALVFRSPSTQHLHQLDMGSWVGQKGIMLGLVALGREEGGGGELVAAPGAPLAGAVVEAIEGLGGSSVATRVCSLRHKRLNGVSEAVEHALLDETITQFLNGGSRINQLRVEIEDGSLCQLEEFYARHGFVRSIPDERAGPGRILLSGERDAALAAVRGILEEGDGGGADAVVMNLQARLLHDAGDLEGAVDAYLKAVQMDPSRSEVFRGLGGAYQSQGQHQMAFASYQQAINVAPTDLLAYLKLGLLYEELAVGKYEEAGDHAIRCFDYYLQHSGSEDTDVLTRLGNLQVLRLDPTAAVRTYERALAVDPSLSNVWFNLANAHLKLGHEEDAARCLREKLKLDPDAGVSTKYMLASLESDPQRLTKEDQVSYARELFDYYAPKYDDHMRKKLLYTAPRMLRQNVREVYNATFQDLPEATRSAHDGDVLSYLNQSLDILDLGCGTGLVGSWFKDYGKRIVGLDISPVMLDMATKKGCYHELRRGDIGAYLEASDEQQFDLVVAAETLQYLGPLDVVFANAFGVLKPDGLFAFTVDRIPGEGREGDSEMEEREDGRLHPIGENNDIDVPEIGGSETRYTLKTDGTYAYCRPYLQGLARQSGYEIIMLKQHAARVERGDPAPGYMGVFRRPAD